MKEMICKLIEDAVLRFSVLEESVRKNGEPVEGIVCKGRNDDGEEIVSGLCLGEVLESIEKWQDLNALAENNLSAGHFFIGRMAAPVVLVLNTTE